MEMKSETKYLIKVGITYYSNTWNTSYEIYKILEIQKWSYLFHER